MKIFHVVSDVGAIPRYRFSHFFKPRKSRTCYGTFIVCVPHRWSLMCVSARDFVSAVERDADGVCLGRKSRSYFTITAGLI